jgi:hypothetical protein
MALHAAQALPNAEVCQYAQVAQRAAQLKPHLQRYSKAATAGQQV